MQFDMTNLISSSDPLFQPIVDLGLLPSVELRDEILKSLMPSERQIKNAHKAIQARKAPAPVAPPAAADGSTSSDAQQSADPATAS